MFLFCVMHYLLLLLNWKFWILTFIAFGIGTLRGTLPVECNLLSTSPPLPVWKKKIFEIFTIWYFLERIPHVFFFVLVFRRKVSTPTNFPLKISSHSTWDWSTKRRLTKSFRTCEYLRAPLSVYIDQCQTVPWSLVTCSLVHLWPDQMMLDVKN